MRSTPGLIVLFAACSPFQAGPPETAVPAAADARVASAPSPAGMRATLAATMDSLMAAGIADRVAPGTAVAVARHGQPVLIRGYGHTDWAAGSPAVNDSTLYDLASLTKVIATTTAAMLLEEDGALDLDRHVHEYVPAYDQPDKRPITVRMLLNHTSGMSTALIYREAQGREEYIRELSTRPLRAEPGTESRYSDWNLITMQFVVEAISGMHLDEFLEARLFGPLGMRDTGFNPDASLKPRIAPTEVQDWRGGQVHGIVHDENSWAMGGVAGHAGLFSSARDLAVYAQMLLNGGEYEGVRILRQRTIARWTAPQVRGSSRALGWDTPFRESSAGRYFSPRSFGHTGFTGTSIWLDPERGLFAILLTNRVNPTRQNTRIFPFRRAFADAVQEAVLDAPLRDWEESLPAAGNR